jgi:hypothetical protein
VRPRSPWKRRTAECMSALNAATASTGR